jgi:fumarate reductase flavoprotein subunit
MHYIGCAERRKRTALIARRGRGTRIVDGAFRATGQDRMGMSSEFDAIVVGAGAAGLMAALRGAARGRRILLLECADGSESDFAKSGGGVSAAGTRQQADAGIEDTPALWEEDIARKTGGQYEAGVVRMVTGRAREALHFLSDEIGIPIHIVEGLPVLGHRVARLHSTPSEGGREFANLMSEAVSRQGHVTRLDRAPVIGLVQEEARIAGVIARVDGKEQTFMAPFTLLACGGFAGNIAMLREHIPEVVDGLHIGSPTNIGSGILWAQQLGAATAFMDSYQGHGHVTADGTGRLGLGLTSLGAIVIDREGRRFVREDIGPSELAAYVLAAPGGEAIEVYDRQAHDNGLRLEAYRKVVEARKVATAASVEELAAAFQLPVQALASTLDDYNRFASGDERDPLSREAHARPLQFPLFGVRITGALAHTQGGLCIDTAARVLRADGAAIPGLLAAGGTAVGISGYGAAGYSSGNGLAQAFVLGMVAADTVAAQTRSTARQQMKPRE